MCSLNTVQVPLKFRGLNAMEEMYIVFCAELDEMLALEEKFF